MTFRQFFVLFLSGAFSFVLLSCTSSGNNLSEDIYQEEEEEYENSRNNTLIAEEDSEEQGEDSLGSEDQDDMSVVGEMGDINVDNSEGESGLIAEDDSSSYEASSIEIPKTKKTWIPLKKIPSSPWKQEGRWINAVYIARDGDTLRDISLSLFGNEDSQVDLRNVNPFLRRRSPKVGDKIYYTSPKRPNDRERFLHYFEEKGELPLTHDIQAGQNIRTVSAELLGHPDSWKEIWATNPQLVSKGVVNEPVTVQYWAGKDNIETPPPPLEETAPPEEVLSENNENMDMPSPEEDILKEESPVEEPPTLGEIEAPASPVEENLQKIEEPQDQDKDQSNVLKIAAVISIIVIIGFILIKIIRNRKNKDFDFSQTHIDIDNIEE